MAKQSPISTIELKGWVGGLNREADPFQLEPDESPDALNVDFGLRGAVSKRKGYKAHTTSHSTATRGTFLEHWEELGAGDWFLYVDSAGVVWYTNSGTLSAAGINYGTASEPLEFPFAFAAMNNKIYVTTLRHATANPRSFDGTTWSSLTKTAFDGTSATFPKAAFLVSHRERVFAFNVKTAAGTRYRSRVYWSEPADPETWAALSYIDVSPDDGQEITGAYAFGETIMIFKNRSLFLLTGVDEKSFTLYPVDAQIGCEAPKTVRAAGAQLFFFDYRSGVWAFDGAGFEKIDEKINTYLLEGINQANAYKSSGGVYRNRYWLSVPWGASTTPNRTFVYDTENDAWTEYDFGVADAADLDGVFYAVGNRDAVGIFEMESGPTDVAANIDAYFYTHWFAPEGPSTKHRLRRTDTAFTAAGDYNIHLDMYRNFGLSPYVEQTVNTNPGGFIWDTAKWGTDAWGLGSAEVLARQTGWGERWRVVQFKFWDDTAATFQVNKMIVQVSSLDRVRGEF